MYNDFDNENLCGWTLGGNTANAKLSTAPISGEDGNYALTYTTSATNHLDGYAYVNVPDAKFSADKEIVVKTRIMHSGPPAGGASDARMQFKFNRATSTLLCFYFKIHFTLNYIFDIISFETFRRYSLC